MSTMGQVVQTVGAAIGGLVSIAVLMQLDILLGQHITEEYERLYGASIQAFMEENF